MLILIRSIGADANATESTTLGCGGEAINSSNENKNICITPNCSCLIHHSNQYGGGVINSDGTIYISEIKYVQNYLRSFLYIEELQKFKEEEYYQESLELEPDHPVTHQSPLTHQSPGKFSHTVTSLNAATTAANTAQNNQQQQQLQQYQHRKTYSLFNGAHNQSPALVAETKDAINDYKMRHHPLDDSLVETAMSSNGVSKFSLFSISIHLGD